MNTTIKTLAFMVVTSFVFMGGCLAKLTSIDFDLPTEAIITTEEQVAAGTHTLGESVLTSTLKAELEKNNTSVDLLDELKVKRVSVTFAEDSAATFDNIDDVSLWISADGSPEVLMASKTVAKGLHSVDLDINTNENLANYMKATTFTYRIKGTNNAPIQPMVLKVNAVWVAKATAK